MPYFTFTETRQVKIVAPDLESASHYYGGHQWWEYELTGRVGKLVKVEDDEGAEYPVALAEGFADEANHCLEADRIATHKDERRRRGGKALGQEGEQSHERSGNDAAEEPL